MGAELNSVSAFIQQLGVPVAMLVAFGWWIVRQTKDCREERATMATAHKAERDERSTQFLAALKENGDRHQAALQEISTRIHENTEALNTAGQELRDTSKEVDRIAENLQRAVAAGAR